MEEQKTKKSLIDGIVLIAITLAIALLVVNNFMLYDRGIKVAEAKEAMEEQLRPAELQIIKLTSSNCESCFDVEDAVEGLKNQNVNIASKETIASDSTQGKELISRYNIQKLPTIIVSGEINKSEQLANYFESKGEILEGKFIYTSLIPPYLEVSSNRIRGKVKIKHLVDSSCEKCTDLSSISEVLKEQGVFIDDETSIEYNSDEGQQLISQAGVKKVPAVLVSDEVGYYTEVKDALEQSETTKRGGFYAVYSSLPPYRDLSQNKVIGLVDVVYLSKGDCSTCHNASVNRNILLNFGVALNDEKTYDINSQKGKQLVEQYSIKKVPMVILSPDAKYYPSLEQAWKSVGTVEDDGWFVMRNSEVLGTYWDIEKNKTIEIAY